MTVYDDAAKKLTSARTSTRAAITQSKAGIALLAPTQSEGKACATAELELLKIAELQLTEAIAKVRILTPAGAVPTKCSVVIVPVGVPLPPPPPPPPNGILSGSVVGLVGATITVSGIGLVMTTGTGGAYSLADVPPGTYTVTASKAGYVSQGAPGVVITAGVTTTRNFTLVAEEEPPAPEGDLVAYPNANIAFICGPQLVHGSTQNPWVFFDSNAFTRALFHGAAFAALPTDSNEVYEQHYYDESLALYIEYYRTGDTQFRTLARAVADKWYASQWVRLFSNSYISPRATGTAGLLLRMLDGRPEMEAGITTLAREQYNIWLGPHLADSVLYLGVRDGGLLLRHLAEIATVHSNAGVRAEFTAYALAAAKDYYARLQNADGGWYWDIDNGAGHVTAQPFMVGMLLEGLIATHQLTGDATVRASILAAVNWLWTKGYDSGLYTNIAVGKRSMRYFVIKDQALDTPGSALLYGLSDGAVRDNRQLNPVCIHAFGYAYHLTGTAHFRTRGDEIFASSFGKGQGPGADAYYCLADYVAKSNNQCYRSGGRYTAWR